MTKLVLITGATSGIGKEVALQLAMQDYHTVIIGRSENKTIDVVQEIKRKAQHDNVDYLLADLSSMQATKEMASRYKDRYSRLDILVNNVGGFFLKRQESTEGIEMTFALNHLSSFCLTLSLLDILTSSGDARIINTSSEAHRGREIDFDDVEGKRRYSGWRAYGQSKTANILFTYELARRLKNKNVTVNAYHPGFVATNIGKNNGVLARFFVNLAGIFGRSVEEGADTCVYLATSEEMKSFTGKYFYNRKEIRSDPYTYDISVAQRLWKLSVEYTGVGG